MQSRCAVPQWRSLYNTSIEKSAKRPDLLKACGQSFILQGSFLLFFDVVSGGSKETIDCGSRKIWSYRYTRPTQLVKFHWPSYVSRLKLFVLKLVETLSAKKMGFYQLHKTQKIPASIEEVWDFISSPANLKRITPEYMGFEITSELLEDKMYPGMIISYKVSPVPGLKMNWVTEITHVKEKEYFVDEQRIGPYKMWHHEHKIMAIEGGVLMTDIVSYQPPFGFLGAVANALFIKKQLREIFDYRTVAVEKIFGVMN